MVKYNYKTVNYIKRRTHLLLDIISNYKTDYSFLEFLTTNL